MPKFIDWEKIRKYWENTGDKPTAIAARFHVSSKAVADRIREWKKRSLADSAKVQNDKKLVSILSFRKNDELDDLEVVNGAIATLASHISDSDVDVKSLGPLAGGVCRLIELKLKLKPRNAAELAEQAIASGITPEEFVKVLRDQWRMQA